MWQKWEAWSHTHTHKILSCALKSLLKALKLLKVDSKKTLAKLAPIDSEWQLLLNQAFESVCVNAL